MILAFLLLLVAAPLLIAVLRRTSPQPRRPSQGRNERLNQASTRRDAFDVDERIAELEGEFGFLPDRRWRDRGSDG